MTKYFLNFAAIQECFCRKGYGSTAASLCAWPCSPCARKIPLYLLTLNFAQIGIKISQSWNWILQNVWVGFYNMTCSQCFGNIQCSSLNKIEWFFNPNQEKKILCFMSWVYREIAYSFFKRRQKKENHFW